MAVPEVDFAQVFRQLPIPVLLVTPDLVIADANVAYLQVLSRTREELIGRDLFEAFPDNPADPEATGVRNIRDSMRRAMATGEPDTVAFQRYDVEVPGRPGVFEHRYWCPVIAPVVGPDGRVAFISACVEELTHKVRRFVEGLPSEEQD
ncbi:MAG TPA: PAS domain-containing protein [Streptosporangiaceae bacterium]|jgi:PAS domain-containing protein